MERCFEVKRALLAVFLVLCCFASPALSAGMKNESPFTFMYGLEPHSALEVTEAFGLNTLYLEIPPSALEDLDPYVQLVRRAHEHDLKVIIGLPTCLYERYRVSPYDEEYLGTSAEVIAYIVSVFSREEGVSAWATGHSLERYIDYNDRDFQVYLRRIHPTLDLLNSFWGSSFPTWPEITLQRAEAVDAQAPAGVGRARMDAAHYRMEAFHDIMAHWLAAIRTHDAYRPVFTGRVTLYRSLVSIPDGYDVVCVSMPPDILEPDIFSHNVQALGMARRGGRFQTLQVLRVPLPGSRPYDANSMHGWIRQAALHGAVGVALEDWPMMHEAGLPVVRALAQAFSEAWPGVLWGIENRCPVAVISSPYAEGFQVTAQPIYGYIKDLFPGQPSRLITSLRLGTRFGMVDYLSITDLVRTDLNDYSAILAPSCLDLPAAAAGVLDEYVRRGGVLVSDIGFGLFQTGSWLVLPTPFDRAGGIIEMDDLKERAGHPYVVGEYDFLPSVRRGMRAVGGVTAERLSGPHMATARRPYAVKGLSAEAVLSDGTFPVAVTTARQDARGVPWFVGLFAGHWGVGHMLQATHPLWADWPLTDEFSEALHYDLFVRRARYELIQKPLLCQEMQMAVTPRGVVLHNTMRQGAMAEVGVFGTGQQVYHGAINRVVPTVSGSQGSVMLVAWVPGQDMLAVRRTPLVVQPHSDEALVEVERYDSEGVVVRLNGPGARILQRGLRGLEISNARTGRMRVVLGNGEYAVAPGSVHRVTKTTRGARVSSMNAIANDRGEIDLSGMYRQDTLYIEPAGTN